MTEAERTHDRDRAHHIPTLVGALVLAISLTTAGLNVVGMVRAHGEVAPHIQAIHVREAGDLLHLAETHGDASLRGRVVVYLRMGEVADGRPVISFPEALRPYNALGLGRTRVLVHDDYDPALTADEAETLAAYPSFESDPQRGMQWTMVPAPPGVAPGDNLRVMDHDGRRYIVDQAVLEAEGIAW